MDQKQLTGEDILTQDDLPREPVDVPEWGGSIWIRTMTGIERDGFEAGLAEQSRSGKSKAEQMRNYRARLVVMVACDKAGVRLFNDNQADALGAKNAAAIERCYDVAERLNLIGDQEVVAEAKKSEPITDAVSISG
jgi:hypothetical protein